MASRRKNKIAQPRAASITSGNTFFNRWGGIVLVVAIALIPFIIGKYLEFSQPDAYDGSLNIYSARQIQLDRHYNSPISARPATLLVNYIGVSLFGYSETGPKIIQMLMQIAGLGMMFFVLRKLYGILPAGVALILASFYLSHPLFAKTGNVKEQHMIGCMLIMVSCYILRHLAGKSFWLIIAGAFAANIYYFKPTGVSAIIAIMVYMVVSVVFRWQKIRAVIIDAFWIYVGVNIGLLPLISFYAWRGMARGIINQFPGNVIIFFLPFLLAIGLLWFSIQLWKKKKHIVTQIKINRKIYRGGMWLVAGVFLITLLYFVFRGDTWGYLKNIWIVALFLDIKNMIPSFKMSIISGEYVSGSRAVSDLSTQIHDVMKYYLSFVVPIGLSLVGIFWSVIKIFTRPKNDELIEENSLHFDERNRHVLAERLMIIFAVWWILDMAFVWVSPRNYVQYYLPLNASAGFIIAYVLYHGRHKPVGYLYMLAALWLVDPILVAIKYGAGGSPAIGLWPSNYWGEHFVKILPLILGFIAFYFTSEKKNQRYRPLALVTVLFLMIFMINAMTLGSQDKIDAKNEYWPSNFTQYQERLDRVEKSKGPQGLWQAVGSYVKSNSSESDYIYVWGWVPGIYVQAQRSCVPKVPPAESNMHSDSPEFLAKKIKDLLAQFENKKPLYIVDSQKSHYPYYSHPNFDLWPVSSNGAYMPADKLEQYQEVLDKNVYVQTLAMLTAERRPGGPLAQDRAEELATLEQQRHQAMVPLRKFVMGNYVPVNGDFGNMKLYKRKD
ncbi:MAG: glycosyltransferase family 39 protein [Phycisphaerae bacterium]|nr:glycosyltransferase family 39 protein [Phycisphaerae bacterium]